MVSSSRIATKGHSCRACLEALELRRLFAFGQLDLTFGSAARVITSIDELSPSHLQDLEVTADGKVLGGGSGGLVQWSSGGDLDTGFGTSGRIDLADVTYRDHTIGADGRIYVLASGPAGTTVQRYSAAGAADATFGAGGTALVSAGTFTPAALAVQDDGKVVVAGTVKTDNGAGAKARVYRLNDDGSADMGFGAGASVDINLGTASIVTPITRDAVAGLAISAGGNIVIGGSSLAYSPEFYDDDTGTFRAAVYGDSVFATAQLTAGGALDAAYGSAGVARAVYATGETPAAATAFARKGDGSIALAAYTDRLVYAQIDSAGVATFTRRDDLDGFGRPLDMAAGDDGRVMLLGVADAVTGQGLQLAYIDASGDLSNVVQTHDLSSATVDLLESSPAAIAIAADGNVLVGGRPDDASAAYEVMKFDTGDAGAARPDEFADARGNDIVRDSAGGVHFAYFDAALRVLKYAYRAPNGLWNDPVTVDGAFESGHYLSLAVDANGRPGIAYFDGFHGDLRYAFSATDGTWTTQLVEGNGSVGLYPSLQFDPSQQATIAYYRKTGGDLKLAVLLADGQWAFELVDSANDVGRSTALVAQPTSGRWSIAYTDTTTSSVKFAWRTKNKTWQVETAATTQGGADFLSLAYNPFTLPEGVFQKPAISYYDAFAGDLTITQSHGTGWTPKVLATQGAQGLYGTLTFDALVGPSVYYYNRTAARVTRITDSVSDGLKAETLVQGGGRFLSVFSNGTTVDAAYFDEADDVLKVRTFPLRV